MQGILSVQKHFRGLRARRYFQELKTGVTVLQSGNGYEPCIDTVTNHKVFLPQFFFVFAVVRGSLARKEFNTLGRKMSTTNHLNANGDPSFKLHDLVVCQDIRVLVSKFFLVLHSSIQITKTINFDMKCDRQCHQKVNRMIRTNI